MDKFKFDVTEAGQLSSGRLSHYGPKDDELEDQETLTWFNNLLAPEDIDCLFGYSESMDFDPFTSFVEERFDPNTHIPDTVNSSFAPLQESPQPSTPDHQINPPSFVSDSWLSSLPPATSTPRHKSSRLEDFPQNSRFSLDRGQSGVYWDSDGDLDKVLGPSLSPIRYQMESYQPSNPQSRSSVRRPRRLFHPTSGSRVEPYSRPYTSTSNLSSAGNSECSSSSSSPSSSPDFPCDQNFGPAFSLPTLSVPTSSCKVEEAFNLRNYVLEELKQLVRVLSPIEEEQ